MKFNRFPSPLFSPVFPFLQYPHYKEEMYLQAQRAFGVSPERHYRFLHAAAEEKPKLVVLSVIVYEAEGLEAKDANGNYMYYRYIFLYSMSAQYCPINRFNCVVSFCLPAH